MAARYELYNTEKNGETVYYFNLIAANNQVIATSQMYKSKQGAEKGIDSVKENSDSPTIDKTDGASEVESLLKKMGLL
ncbi:YegP family protein [Vibrio fluvialis]|nr:YegP family protein [Vibrio fluvialis]